MTLNRYTLPQMPQIVYEIFSFAAAFCTGLYAFRYMDRFFRIIYFQVIVWIVFFALSHAVTIYQESNNLNADNQFVMNFHLLIETLLLLAAAGSFSRVKRLAVMFSAIFLVVVAVQILFSGFSVYFNYGDVTACIGITVVYTFLLYTFFRKCSGSWWHSAEIILCIGLLIYFACSVPYLAMMHYLQHHHPELNHLLFDFISNVLACIRYLATAVAFWLVFRKAHAPIHVP